MPWLKSASEFPENDKVWPISDSAYRLYDAMRHYCARKLTDGHVPLSRLSALTPKPPKKEIVAELLEARLIHRTADICAACVRLRVEKKAADPLPKGGYLVHDYLNYNPPRWRWLADQAQRRQAGKQGGQNRWHGEMPSGSPSEMHGEPLSEMPSEMHGPYPVSRTPSFSERKRGRTPEDERFRGVLKAMP